MSVSPSKEDSKSTLSFIPSTTRFLFGLRRGLEKNRLPFRLRMISRGAGIMDRQQAASISRPYRADIIVATNAVFAAFMTAAIHFARDKDMVRKEIEKKRFGRSGHLSARTIFGAAALKNATTDEASRTLDILLEYGVNHIDTAPRYGNAEALIGPWMREHRDRFFLATKTGLRNYRDSRDEIRRSLDRLRVDRVDLLQLHSLAHPGDWERVMGEGGALEAVIEAREEGLTRFVGVTGHGWTIASMHLKSLERFDFDSVLMPWNFVMYENERYRLDFDAVCQECSKRDVAVQTIKAIARGPWATAEENRNTWYQPLEEADDIENAVHWVLARPDLFLNTVGDLDLLPLVLDAACRFEGSPEDDTMRALVKARNATSLFGIGT